jgi:hypothetical protein
VFGPGAEDHGHSLTLSGEGVLDRQLLCIYCVSRAPKLKGWTFHAARQPGALEELAIEIAGQKFAPADLWLTTAIDAESEKLDIAVWHPSFSVFRERNERMTPVFLLLDEALGEFGVEQWIGGIDLHDKRPAGEMIPLTELRSLISRIESEKGWKKSPPGESPTLYSFKEPHDRFLRGDIVAGNTTHTGLINDYVRARGKMKDPIAGTGASYVFVAFDSAFLPQGRQSAARGEIEGQLDTALRSAHSGRLIGGAFGVSRSYIDLLVFDGNESLKIVEGVLRDRGLPAGTAIHFFASDKPAPAVVL